ncbi:MAG: DUF748 domain-containing protein [Gammaproteobacteria bacterium]
MSFLIDKAKHYKWQLSVLIIALLFVIFLWVLPLIISQQFQKWVLANGGEEVTVENVDFNIFTADFKMEGVVIKRSGYEPLLLPVLELKAKLWDLLDRRVVINRIKLEGVELTIDQSEPEAQHVGGILLKNIASEEKSPADEKSEPWTFNIQELSLTSFTVLLKHSNLNSKLLIKTLNLKGLDSLPGTGAAQLKFQGELDNAALELEGELTPFSEEPGFKGTLSLQSLDLEPYLAFVTGSSTKQAVVSIDTALHVQQLTSGKISVKQQGNILLGQLKLPEADMTLIAEKLKWDGSLDLTVDQAKHIQVNADGDFNLSGADLKLENKLDVLADTIAWQGDIDVNLSSETQLVSQLNGKFTTGNFQFNSQEKDISLSNTMLNWQGDLNVKQNANQLEITANGKLLNEGHKLSSPTLDLNLVNQSLDWQGSLNVDKKTDQLETAAQGKLINAGLNLSRPTQQVNLVNQTMNWQGDVNVAINNQSMGLQSASQLRLDDFSIMASGDVERLIEIKQVRFDDVVLASLEDVKAQNVSLKGLSVGNLPKLGDIPENLPGFANYDELLFEDLAFSGKEGLSINRIAQAGVQHVVLKDESGEWIFFSVLRAINRITGNKPQQEEETKQASEQVSEEATAFSIETVETVDAGVIYYIDQSLPEKFIQKIMIDKFKVTGINSKSTKPSQLELIAQIDDAKAKVNGSIALFDKNRDFDFTINVDALSLLPYSYFMEKSLGYEVDSGSLIAKGTYKARDAVLESTTELTLHQLDVRALTAEELKKLDAKQNSGLETGLSMLKDKNDTIELSIPVNGKFDELKVDPGDIINQALGSALKTGAKTYFAAALFPFGTLLVVADAVGSNAMQVKLDPVYFDADKTDLQSKFQEYLSKVANVLEEKPEIFIKVCGVAVNADRSALIAEQKKLFQEQLAKKEPESESVNKKDSSGTNTEAPAFKVDEALLKTELQSIAKQRGKTVSRYLIDKLSVVPKRLIPCQPRDTPVIAGATIWATP